MAGREHLIRPGLAGIAGLAGLALLVLFAHLLTIDWVGRSLGGNPRLKEMADPMFTRVLQQAAPPPVPAAAPVARPPARAPRKTAIAAAPVASQPRAEAPAPPPESAAPVAPKPTAVASAAAPSTASGTATLAASPGAMLDSWPADTRVSYRLVGNYRGEVNGRGRVQWQRLQDQYQVRVDVDVAVLLSFAVLSQGKVTATGLLPSAFEEIRPGGSRSVEFTEDKIRLHDGTTVPRPDAVQDTASQFAELSHRFSSGQEKLEVGRNVQLWLARPGGVDLWTYDIVAKDLLDTPEMGKVEAFHIKPRPLAKPRGNITAEMWFAPSLQYLPVKVRMSMGDEAWLDLTVLRIEQGGTPVAPPPGTQPEAPGPARQPNI